VHRTLAFAFLVLGLASAAHAQPAEAPPAAETRAPEPPPSVAPPPSVEPPPSVAPPPSVEPPPSVAQPPADGATEEEPDSGWPIFYFHARVMTGFEVARLHPENGQASVDETQPELFLDQAVVEAEVLISKRISAELGFNLGSANVRDAFINYRARDSLQFRVGRFKRPFSRLELRSRAKLPFRDRGLMNELVLTEDGFAGRALGAMIWGKPTEQIRYSLAAANPAPIGSGIEGVDLIARIVYDPTPWLLLGLNAMHKWTERFANGPNLSLHAVGADARIEIERFSFSIEADAAQNPNPPAVSGASASDRTPWALGVVAYADYAFKLTKKWSLGPVLVLEWMDTDTEYGKDERVRAVAGLSWNYRKNALRVMPQVEIIRPAGAAAERGEVASETYYVLVSTDI
jgi:hypothetical protein